MRNWTNMEVHPRGWLRRVRALGIVAWVACTVGVHPLAAQYQTLGPGSCGLAQNNCHATENTWWKNDPHKATVEAFYDDPQAYEKIARLAGVAPGDMLKGDHTCMTCHGTVISGKEARETEDGVSCESCHGPGSGYKDPHSEGDPKLGLNRPGYVKALQLGMVELKNIDKRAVTCVRCHYITDQKLLAAGHPDGARFNYVSGIRKVAKHWQRPPAEEDLNKAPFERAMNARGPATTIARLTPEPAPPPTRPPPSMQQPAPAAPVGEQTPGANTLGARTPPLRPSETSPLVPPPATAPLELPPFPAISDTMKIEEIMLILKRRLELLYQKTGS